MKDKQERGKTKKLKKKTKWIRIANICRKEKQDKEKKKGSEENQ